MSETLAETTEKPKCPACGTLLELGVTKFDGCEVKPVTFCPSCRITRPFGWTGDPPTPKGPAASQLPWELSDADRRIIEDNAHVRAPQGVQAAPALDAAEAGCGWIRSSESLPEKDAMVLLWWSHDEPSLGWWTGTGFTTYTITPAEATPASVTHWRPIVGPASRP
jgi:hypothetical protein